jgi:hypothetical protein
VVVISNIFNDFRVNGSDLCLPQGETDVTLCMYFRVSEIIKDFHIEVKIQSQKAKSKIKVKVKRHSQNVKSKSKGKSKVEWKSQKA